MTTTTTTSIEETEEKKLIHPNSLLLLPHLLLSQAQERADAAARKAELKRIAEQEDAEAAAKMTAKAKAAKASGGAPAARTLRGAGSSAALAALSGASQTPPPPGATSSTGDFPAGGKVTHHQLRQEAEAEAREREAARQRRLQKAKREVAAEEYEAALDEHGGSHSNRAVGADDVDARSLEAAVAALSVSGAGGEEGSDDRYPERRARAAFAAYQERELARLKGDRPGLKLSQYKELVWRSWQKSPENPIFMSGRG